MKAYEFGSGGGLCPAYYRPSFGSRGGKLTAGHWLLIHFHHARHGNSIYIGLARAATLELMIA
jgi:hypothetical protein